MKQMRSELFRVNIMQTASHRLPSTHDVDPTHLALWYAKTVGNGVPNVVFSPHGTEFLTG